MEVKTKSYYQKEQVDEIGVDSYNHTIKGSYSVTISSENDEQTLTITWDDYRKKFKILGDNIITIEPSSANGILIHAPLLHKPA